MSTETKDYTVLDKSGGRGEGAMHTVVQASYHRNGVGGAGFIVALIDTLHDGENDSRRFLLTWFPEYDEATGERKSTHTETVAVVAVDEVAKGNVAMYPVHDPVTGEVVPGTGGNAWRGADNWAVVLPVISRWLEDERAALEASAVQRQAARLTSQD